LTRQAAPTTSTSNYFIDIGSLNLTCGDCSNPPLLLDDSCTSRSSTPTLLYDRSSSSSPVASECPTPLSRYEFLKILGKGSSGRVDLVRDRNFTTQEVFALKTIPKEGKSPWDVHLILQEQQVSRLLSSDGGQCRFLGQLIQSWHDSRNFYLLTEYVPGGDFAQQLLMRGKLSEDATRFYASEIIVALEALQNRNVVHRDIKPLNLLLDSDGHLVLTDYGYAKVLSLEEPAMTSEPSYLDFSVPGDAESGSFLKPRLYTHESCVGTTYFRSPDLIQGKRYGLECDLWSLGTLIYLMLFGTVCISPFPSYIHYQLFPPLRCPLGQTRSGTT
jgi:serine/threonine protein kinase